MVVSCCRGGETRISGLHAGCCLKVGWPCSAIKFREGKGGPVEKQTARGKCVRRTTTKSTTIGEINVEPTVLQTEFSKKVHTFEKRTRDNRGIPSQDETRQTNEVDLGSEPVPAQTAS